MHHNHEIIKGASAVVINAMAIITSTQEHFEFWLRCSSLVVGILVGVLTAISICRKLKSKP
jgi:hypothetical protein